MRHRSIWTFVVSVLVLAGTLAHAEGRREEPVADRVPVVATTTIVGDIVARVGGDRLSLYVMLPLGADPHAFQATPRDARQAADAAIVFVNGAGLEVDFLGDLIASAEPRRVVDLSAHLNLRRMAGGGHDHDHGEFDAHVWMDPTLVAAWTAEIADALAEVDPDHGADYARRADALAGELHALDAWVRERVAAIPRDRRILITDHGMSDTSPPATGSRSSTPSFRDSARHPSRPRATWQACTTRSPSTRYRRSSWALPSDRRRRR